MSFIHPTAIISKEAKLANNVSVGPFSVITGKVTIGEGTKIGPHVQVGNEYGKVIIGKNNELFKACIVGGEPQDLSYKKEETELIIGDGNIIREFANIHVGTIKDKGITRIGNNCLMMVSVHIAHDCVLQDNIIICNQASLAGHVKVQSKAFIGSFSGVVQFSTIGRNAYITPFSVINKDILPFTIAKGNSAQMRAVNKIGLERSGYTPEEISEIRKCLNYFIKGSLTIKEAIEKTNQNCKEYESIQEIINFSRNSKKGIARQ